MRTAMFDTRAERRAVPESIEFGEQCVVVPDLTVLAIPQTLAKLAIMEPRVAIGSWVERGDVLLDAQVPVFNEETRPSWWRALLLGIGPEGSYRFVSHELQSPVSGLVVSMESQVCAYHGDSGATTSGMSLCYGAMYVRPVLLLPGDEPPPSDWSGAYYSLRHTLMENYDRLLYSHRRGYVRLPEAIADFGDEPRADIAAFLKSEPARTDRSVKLTSIQDVPGAASLVETMRARDLVLRRKLRHIGGMAAGA